MNKKGQMDYPIIPFIVIAIGLFIVAPVMMKVFTSIQTPMSAALGNVSGGEVAQENFNTVMTTSANMWDRVVLFVFVIAMIMLIISAFLIDTSPFWVVLYIFISLMTIIFIPNIMDALVHIYGSQAFATEVARLALINRIRTNFVFFLVGIMFLTGIIIYAKINRSIGKGRL